MESSGGLNENMEGSGRSRGLVIITAAVTVTVRNAQEKLPSRATVLGVELSLIHISEPTRHS